MSRFHYTSSQGFAGVPGYLPFVPTTLLRTNNFQRITHRLTLPALVDSGATVNVLPYDIGIRLGFTWDRDCPDTPFVGMIYGVPALGVTLFAKVGQFAPVRFTFGWSQKSSTELPFILGQTNFFDEFYVDFRKPKGFFDILKSGEV